MSTECLTDEEVGIDCAVCLSLWRWGSSRQARRLVPAGFRLPIFPTSCFLFLPGVIAVVSMRFGSKSFNFVCLSVLSMALALAPLRAQGEESGTVDACLEGGRRTITLTGTVLLEVNGDQTRGRSWKVLESTGGTITGSFVLSPGPWQDRRSRRVPTARRSG